MMKWLLAPERSRPERPEEAAPTPTAEQVGQIVVVVLGEGVAEFALAVVDSYVEIMAVVAQKQRCVRAAVDNEVEMPGRGGN